ncbi:hypothetical protein BBJ29_005612 [Phytophthora kernoviae]|uniref:Uncharacterized protein n=1 Tax=Phytophthora kernoviae TaxID=325452 RepID=A0A421GBN4_9STRA|nr:hypothetical protein BBJ29_005612 [Phytophthora kernoviae]
MINMVASSSSVPQQDVEAMEKHMNNKIEYLKAQLASEMKCKEELGSHLAQITNAMEQMKTDKRQALAEQDETFKKQIERIEGAFSQEKEVMTTQQAALQGKLVTLQANVTDLIQELTMWKSKEASAKLAMDKMVEENVRLTRQLVDAEEQVETMQEERKQDAAKTGSMSVMNASEETKRVQMEALLRRLDNERQYLKSQLEGQQELKEKSQKLVTDLQYEIREVKDAMEDAMRDSERRMSELTTEKRNQEQELRGTIECLEEGKLLLNRQLKEVQTKFADAREQALLERDEIEKARIEVNEMRTQLLAAKKDSVKEQAYAKSASERMSKSLAAVKSSLKVMEEEKSKQIRRLEEENAEYIRKLATTQGEMLVLEEKFAAEKFRAKKDKATTMLAMILSEKAELWRMRSQHRTFTHTLHDERLEAIRSMKESHDKDREELNEFYLQDKSQLEEELAALHAAQMQQIKDQCASTSKSVEANAENTIEDLRRQNDQLKQSNSQLAEELTEITQKCEVISCTFEDELGALWLEWERKQANWSIEEVRHQEELQSQRNKAEEQLNLETSRLVTAHAQQLTEVQALQEAELSESAKQFVHQVEMLSEEQSQKYTAFHRAVVAAKAAQHQNELEEAIASVTERWQKEFDRLREAHEHALQDAVAKTETKANAQLVSLQKEMNERKGTAVVQCTSKWQRAMEELQERQEVEKRAAYNEGQQDREKEWQQAAQQIKERQREELDKVQQEAVAAIRAAEERHEMRFQAQLADIKKQLEEQQAQAIQTLTDEITTRERELAQQHLEANNEVLEQELTAKWTLQIEELQTQLKAKLQEEKARLSVIVEENEILLRKVREDHDNQLVELERTWDEKLEALTASTADTHKQEIDTLREELANEHDTSVKQLQEGFVKQLENQLRAQEVRLLRDQEDAIAQVQDDSEKLIDQVERAMEELKKQKEHLESELLGLRSSLEEAEDAHFDAQESFKKQKKQAAFHILHLVMRAQKKLADTAHDKQVSRTELEGKCIQLKETFTGEKNQWEDLMARVQSTWSQVQVQHGEMTQTLTNYRRDELVAHRSTSAVLSNEISIVTKQLEEVEEMKVTLEHDVDALQTEAHSVEASLRDLMLQSGGSSSSLNMAVVAKKRRLNEEFETLLERIEKKKSEVRTVEQTIASLRARREEKEHEMRQMERKLVEILVQQQKQMLLLVSAVREVAFPTSA